MAHGIGADILSVEHIRNSFDDSSHAFLQKTYTTREQDEALCRPDAMLYYATRLAGKEAVFKSLGISADGVRLNDIEILNAADGHPVVALSGLVQRLAQEKGVTKVLISLSSDRGYVVAFAVAEKE